MKQQPKRVLFSAAERAHVARLVVNKPSGIKVTIGGIDVDLLPLTNDDGDELLRLVGLASKLSSQTAGESFGVNVLLELIAREGAKVKAFVRQIIFDSLDAAGAIDHNNEGEAVFNEWYGRLELVGTIKTVGPHLIAASGLTTMLGNPLSAGAATIAPAEITEPLPGPKTD